MPAHDQVSGLHQQTHWVVVAAAAALAVPEVADKAELSSLPARTKLMPLWYKYTPAI
jgi:hypothetical protein